MKRLSYEINLWNQGYNFVAGADEVGRGCLAGPIVAAAVCFDKSILNKAQADAQFMENLESINDSKKLTALKRRHLEQFIKAHALYYAITEISASEIDKIGIQPANINVLINALNTLTNHDYSLIDHIKLPLNNSLSITHGESLSISIAAASILAKQYRDNLMKEVIHVQYPQYFFNNNVGYGTKAHILAINQFGQCEVHRKCFKLKG